MVTDVSKALDTAVGHHQAGRLAAAEEIYRRILVAEPGCAQAWHLLGVIASQKGDFRAASQLIERGIVLQPDDAEAHNNLGIALKGQGRLEEAVTAYRRALELSPRFAEAHNNLGDALQDQGKVDEAIASYLRAIEIKPEYGEAYYNLGHAFRERGKLDEAIMSLRKAIAVKPDYAEAHNNLGSILQEAGDLDNAIAAFRRAIELRSSYVEPHNNLGNALKEQGKYGEAAASYRRAVELNPDYPEPRVNHARLALLDGDFENGWRDYEWRWKLRELRYREFGAPQWNGEPLAGKTILLHAEQGLGDTLQFVRYARMVKKLGANVLLECQTPLTRLLSTCAGIDGLVVAGDQIPRYDVHAALLSLPRIFQTALDSIPADVPYVFAEPTLVLEWKEKLRDVQGFRIGINWHGRAGRIESRKRDILLELFGAVAQLPGVKLISLQKDAKSELATANRIPILDPGEIDTAHGAFMDSAAIMKNIDLVITSDTSVPHLAGALGVPVWLALPFVPDWRWLLDRGDSPWYPTMRLFRQERAGDWAGVFDGMLRALQEMKRSNS